MCQISGGVTKNIAQVFEYAKSNLKTKHIFSRINEVTNMIRKNFEDQ